MSKPTLLPFHDPAVPYEIALDECGRGPMFGRVYAAAVVLPRDPTLFDYSLMKDSKKIHSKKKMRELAEYIRTHALYTSVQYEEADVVDRVNILQADMLCMHKCIREIMDKSTSSPNPTTVSSASVARPGHSAFGEPESTTNPPFIEDDGGSRSNPGLPVGTQEERPSWSTVTVSNTSILVDGNYFKPYGVYDDTTETLKFIPHTTIEKGDGKYAGIAAASILAKYERDAYIAELCREYPVLSERYALDRNMGYGTKAHMEGIATHGITQWHRRSFGACKSAKVTNI